VTIAAAWLSGVRVTLLTIIGTSGGRSARIRATNARAGSDHTTPDFATTPAGSALEAGADGARLGGAEEAPLSDRGHMGAPVVSVTARVDRAR
jgi:hypothetical protein